MTAVVSPGAAVGRKAGLKLGARLLDGMLRRWGGQTSASAFLKVFRKVAGQGHSVPPHSCLRGPCIPPGGLPSLQPALPAACILNPQAAGAAWGLGQPRCPPCSLGWCVPYPWDQGRNGSTPGCFPPAVLQVSTTGHYLWQGIMRGALINSNLINSNGRERPGQYRETCPHCPSGEAVLS